MSDSYIQQIENLLYCIKETSEISLSKLNDSRLNGIEEDLKSITHYVNNLRVYISIEERRVK